MAAPTAFKKLLATKQTKNFREAVQITTASLPEPGADEIVVRNRFVGINAADINVTAGKYLTGTFPLDIGIEGVGTVVARGDNVKDINTGQPVGFLKIGAYSEYIVLKNSEAYPLPISEPKAEIIPLLTSALTAAIGLDKAGEIKRGEKVLVTAAAGGTGQFAVQWAKAAGCHVIGTCSTDEKVDTIKKLGCDRPINTNKEDLEEVLKKEYPNGVDVVYESIGGKVFDVCVNSLAKKGRLVIIGYISGYENDSGQPDNNLGYLPKKLLYSSAAVRGFSVFDYTEYFRSYFNKLLQLYLEGSIQAIIDNGVNDPKGPFKGLEAIADGVEYMYSRKSRGKVIVEI